MTTKEKLIKKLYDGTCQRKELELLLDLLKEDSEEEPPQVMAKLWQELQSYPEIEEPMATAMMNRMMERVEEQESMSQDKATTARKKLPAKVRRRHLIQWASAAVFLLLLGIFSWLWLRTEEQIVVQTSFAEQKTIQLPDHSIVKLNANSSLRYPKSWKSTKTRQVWLQGEAYFEVEKKPQTQQKFQVITKDLTIEVLGTIFNVNARTTATKVFLEEGQINLDLEEQPQDILMEPGELVTYSKTTGKPLKKQIEKEAPTSWKDGTAVMKDALLSEIIQKIHEIYDVRMVLENESYREREFTIFLPVSDPELGYQMLVGLGLEMEKAPKQWTIK